MSKAVKLILVTGSGGFGHAGFIGQRLVENLKRKKLDVAEFKGDIRCSRTVRRNFIDRCDVVFHLAAQTSAPLSVKDPVYDFETNALGTLNILSCAKENKARVVFTSSAAVYGEPKFLPIDENHPLRPVSPYGLSKMTAERYCLLFQELYGLCVTVLRVANVFGPGGHGVVNKFLERVLRNKPLIVYGDGEQTRDYIYVDDVTEALVKAVKVTGVYNIGTGKKTSINQLIETMEEVTGREMKVQYKPEKPGDIKNSYFNVAKARDDLKFQPRFTVKNGIKKTLAWMEKEGI